MSKTPLEQVYERDDVKSPGKCYSSSFSLKVQSADVQSSSHRQT